MVCKLLEILAEEVFAWCHRVGVAGPAGCHRPRWSRHAFHGFAAPNRQPLPAPPGSSGPGHNRGARLFVYAVGPLRVDPAGLPCGGAASQVGRPGLAVRRVSCTASGAGGAVSEPTG